MNAQAKVLKKNSQVWQLAKRFQNSEYNYDNWVATELSEDGKIVTLASSTLGVIKYYTEQQFQGWIAFLKSQIAANMKYR